MKTLTTKRLTPERIQKIKSWKKHIIYKEDTYAFNILWMLDTFKEQKYGELIVRCSYNYHRNIRELKTTLRNLESALQFSIDNKQPDIEEYKELIVLKKAEIRYRESTPGTRFKGSLPKEPNFSQVVALMVVDEVIEKVSHGVYRITEKGIKILNSGELKRKNSKRENIKERYKELSELTKRYLMKQLLDEDIDIFFDFVDNNKIPGTNDPDLNESIEEFRNHFSGMLSEQKDFKYLVVLVKQEMKNFGKE
ncbi:MAG: hypothetical protein NUV97_00585 [archaeon]|nr:hypothetical protein [archaeon]